MIYISGIHSKIICYIDIKIVSLMHIFYMSGNVIIT